MTTFPAIEDDSLYAEWEASSGADTDYGNHLEVAESLDSLLEVHSADSTMTDELFRPIFDDFVQRHLSLAVVTEEGVEPKFRFPYHYFVNKDGIYRICNQEFQIVNSFLLSYPVGMRYLVDEWNGKEGDFGLLRAYRLKGGSGSEQILETRDEYCEEVCTDKLDNNKKKRIKVIWVSEAFHVEEIPDGNGNPRLTGYWWYHQGEVRAQRKRFFIWFKEKRHIALEVRGEVRNFHAHPDIPVDETHSIDFFECRRTNKLKQLFAEDHWIDQINSALNQVDGIVNVTGTNRTSDCNVIQAECSFTEILECPF